MIKKSILAMAMLLNLTPVSAQLESYFERPVNCPLRLSNLTQVREQIGLLVSSLSGGCTQSAQQALNQLNSNFSNLEGIANTWEKYNSADDIASNPHFAKNLNQVLGNLNIITASNSCFYDIKSRGTLPVLADVVMSISQFGLLIPSVPGVVAASAGYIGGSAMKIIHQLVKKKFNFNKADERRAFLQLNCAFFDNRRLIEEAGVFNPESAAFRDELAETLRKERAELIKTRLDNEKKLLKLEKTLAEALAKLPVNDGKALNPKLSKNLNELISQIGKRPADYAEKWRQVSAYSLLINDIIYDLKDLRFNSRVDHSVNILISNLEKIQGDFDQNGRAWISNIDEYEMLFRGPVIAFAVPVADELKKELAIAEAKLGLYDPALAKEIADLRSTFKNKEISSGTLDQRLRSLESKITNLETRGSETLFSANDEGASNTVEILDYHRQLQNSILGKEGKNYLANASKNIFAMKTGLERQSAIYKGATTQDEKCSAAEKVRFAWAEYRSKVKEAHDFIATNLDLYRTSFKIGKEKMSKDRLYVLSEIESVEIYLNNRRPQSGSIGFYMWDAQSKVKTVETLLQESGCF